MSIQSEEKESADIANNGGLVFIVLHINLVFNNLGSKVGGICSIGSWRG